MIEILDSPEEEQEFIKFRRIPLIIEILPILILVIGVIISNDSFTTIGLCTLSLIYTFSS